MASVTFPQREPITAKAPAVRAVGILRHYG